MVKRLISTFFTFLFLITTVTLKGQDKNYPWQVALGVTAIDTYPVGESTGGVLGNQGTIFEDFFNVNEHWNFGGLTISSSRHLTSGFSLGVGLSVSEIYKIEGNNDVNIPYFATEVFLKISPWYKTKLTPYLVAGYGYSRFDTANYNTTNVYQNYTKTLSGSFGLNYKLGKQFGLFLDTQFRRPFERAYTNHFQHQIGLNYIFGSAKKDTDGDGIHDEEDACPQVPGLGKYNGCPDSDGDGVPDQDDDCPQEAGKQELRGCPDTDGDGVPDKHDACPNVMGDAATAGCPDTDRDSVPDGQDVCPFEPGTPENDGCPETNQDSDADTVPDKDDACPDVFGLPENNGCPSISEGVIETLNLLGSKIIFPSESHTIYGRQNQKVLQEINRVLDDNLDSQLIIEGYSSSDGSEFFNMELSEKRALAVKNHLIELGVRRDRLEIIGYGEAKPLDTNETMSGRAANRRVQFRAKF